MPRKSAHSAVQRGGTIDNETKSRRSTRSSMRHDSSGSLATRTRRSSATSQTHVSLTESRVTRSRNTSNRNRSSSPSENTRTRSSREISLESPASRVKTTRRNTGRVNYQESEGEEDMTSTTEKNEEEEYHVEDDLEESDSEESNRSRTRSRTAAKSPPKVRGRGRGRPPKTTKGKSWYASTEENDDDEEEEEEEDSDEKNLEESNTVDEITRRNNKLENESESIRKTRGTKRKIEKESPSMRSTRSGKTIKENTEVEKTHLSATVRQTRSRKISSETTNVSAEDVEMKKENNNDDDTVEEMEIIEEKRKRKLDIKNETKKRFKSDESSLGNEIIKNEIQEKHEKAESLQQSTKLLQSDDKDLDKSQTDKEILPEICEGKKNDLISADRNVELSDKNSNADDKEKETLDLSTLKEKTFIEMTEKISEQISVQKDVIMEVDNDIERKTNVDVLSTKTDILSEENKNEDVAITKEKNMSEPVDQEIKDYSITTITQKEKSELCVMDTDSQKNIFQANNDHKNDALSNLKVSSTALTSLTNTIGIEDSDNLQCGTEKCQEKLLSTKESCVIESDTLPLEPSNSQDSSKHIEEPSNVQEINLKDTENNSSHWNENKSNSSSCGILQSTKAAYSEKNITAEVLSVNGANICTEKSSNNNKNGDIIDMSKVSDNSASETENLSVEPFLPAPSHIECLTKANGAPNDSLDSSNLSCTDLPNRSYVYNSSLSEDSKSCLKSKMFSLVSYNLSAMPNESSSQNEKLLMELKRTNADFICLQEIPKIYYDILESDLNVLGYKGVVSVPENKTRGLGTFYKTSSFNLKKQTGVSLQKIIDQDLETSSLENADKVAIRNFLQKCGHTLMVHFSSVTNDCTLTIANVFFPPSDISTHALQMSSLVREVINFAADIARPHILCGSFNMIEGSVAYQLLREGYLNNEMIEELQKRKDVALPGKDNDTLVNLLWKAFQHPSSNLRSCYATVLGHELHLDEENSVTSPDLLWYSSDSLETIGVLDVIPIDKKNIGPVTLKADIAYIC